MEENTTHVLADNVSKIYRGTLKDGSADVAAVNGISLDVPHGQFLSIMGASGSGKTTLLHMIAGLTKVSKGSIRIGEVRIDTMSDRSQTLFRRDNIGIVFQAFNLIPTLTAEENILLPVLAGSRAKIEKSRIEKALAELLERLQLTARRRHYPDAMSGGEQQRVAIARALFLDYATETHGSLFLADEPTGNLDSANSENICRLLHDLCRERHHTMIVVTHEPSVAKWSDRVIQLKDGKILRDIPASELEA